MVTGLHSLKTGRVTIARGPYGAYGAGISVPIPELATALLQLCLDDGVIGLRGDPVRDNGMLFSYSFDERTKLRCSTPD